MFQVFLLTFLLIFTYAHAPVMAQSINCAAAINFGDIILCGAAGTVTINPDGSRSSTGCLAFGGGPHVNGLCSYTQPFPSTHMVITVDSSTAISSGPNSLTVQNFQINTPGQGRSIDVFDPIGNINIGADLVVPATPADGGYSGIVIVTIDLP